MAVAVASQRLAGDQLHRDVGLAVRARAGGIDLGDIGMAHARQGLALGLEAAAAALVEAAGLDELERHLAAGHLLLGPVDAPHPALSEQLDQAEGADRERKDPRPGAHRHGLGDGWRHLGR